MMQTEQSPQDSLKQIKPGYGTYGAQWYRGRNRDSSVWNYAGVLLAVIVALFLTVAFPASSRPYYLFIGATAAGTWFGGWRAGLIATLASIALAFFVVFLPTQPGSSVLTAHFFGYIGISALVLGLGASLQRTNAALDKSRLHFGGVVQISEDAIMTIDEEQKITLFNAGAEKIFGYSAEEVMGKSVEILLPERYRQAHAAHVRGFGQSSDTLREMSHRGAIRGLRQDGQEFPAEASISKFEAHGVRIMTVRLRDISERLRAEQGVRQLAAIVESSKDGIIAEDLDGIIRSWNPGAEVVYGYTASEMFGRSKDVLVPPDITEPEDYLQRAREGVSSSFETVRLRKDGKRITVALSVSPILDEHGNVAGVSAIARDITERKRLEQQLNQSLKMEAVGRLAGGVAHDFNNLLGVIVGYAYLINSAVPEGEPLRNSGEQIVSAAERASSLTRQLLAFGGKQMLSPKVIDLGEVTVGLGKMIPRLVGEDIDVRISAGERLKHVKADPSQMEQIIMNLVVNARDAMPNGGKLTIETANVYFDESEASHHNVMPGDYVMLGVSDTGEGMDNETRAHIFEPFFTTKDAGKGTGLGLSTVYGIVSQSNGHIWVYSEVGHGTTFKIYLPATTDATTATTITHNQELTVCGNETILLVEDQPPLRELLSHVLRDKGYKVIEAGTGPDALREVALHDGRIDLLLTDVIMPEMRGQHLADALSETHPTMHVIYMSGYTDNALIHSGSVPEDMTFLQKPFTPDVMLRRVREVLDQTAEVGQRRRAI